MRGIKLARIPGVALGLSTILAVATVVLLVRGAGTSTPADRFGLTGFGGLAFVIASLAFAVTGALVATRLPRNPIGWIFCYMGVLIGVGNLPFQYADVALFVDPDGLAGGDSAAVIQNLGLTPCFGLLAFALLLFPDGHLPSRRWRPAAGAALLGSTLVGVGYALRPGRLDPPFHSVENPFGVGSADFMDGLTGAGWLLMALGAAFAAASIVVRYRRVRGPERQQLKWIALAGVGIGALFVANFLSYALDVQDIDQLRLVLVGLAFAALPVAAGIAILRYRLYDIDVVINRTLVYGVLTATLAAIYLGSVLVLQLALGGLTSDSNLAIAVSTLAVAALFRPARNRIQATVDRRFFRRRYDAQRTLDSFSTRLRDQVDLAALDAELRGVVAETMQPAHVSVWLRGAG